jgi:plastocyanin
LLAVSKIGSTVVAIVVASVILGVAFLITSRPKLSSSLLTAVVAIGAIGLLGGGIVGAVAGEREFEAHEEEGGHGGEGESDAPVEIVVSASNTSDFDEAELTVPVGFPVRLVFENNQGGVQHNVHITEPVDLEPLELITGPASTEAELTFDEAGDYTFICDVHPNMEGTIVAVLQPASDEAPDEGTEGGGASVDELDGDDS